MKSSWILALAVLFLCSCSTERTIEWVNNRGRNATIFEHSAEEYRQNK